jgi:hypothetical protein
MQLAEDVPSALAFAKLKDPGFRVVYNQDFANVSRLLISDHAMMGAAKLPRMVNAPALNKFLQMANVKPAVEVNRTSNPELFISAAHAHRGMGLRPIVPLTDMAGSLRCKLAARTGGGAASDMLILDVANNTEFDWKFDTGPLPLKIGVHLRTLGGAMLRWDDGYRAAVDAYVPANSQVQLRVPLRGLNRAGLAEGQKVVVAEFGMVQDGHAWFNNLHCDVRCHIERLP